MFQFDLHGIAAAASLISTTLIVVGPILVLGFCPTPISFRESLLRRIGSWWPYSPSAPDIHVNVPASLPLEAQWSRVTRIVEITICHARTAGAYHAMAALRLDAAEYAFRRMVEDLEPVIARPFMVSAVPAPMETPGGTAPPAALAA